MIALLRGVVVGAGANWCVLDVAGVGYRIQMTGNTTAGLRIGEETLLHTTLVVREDSMTLFGFASEGERDAFELVQSASGVGPKLALAIVSVLTPTQLVQAVRSNDQAVLTKVPGIGKKGAEKIIIELRDRVAGLDVGPGTDPAAGRTAEPSAWRDHVSQGLQSLGWSAKDAETACEKVAELAEADPGISLGKLMKAALQSLARS